MRSTLRLRPAPCAHRACAHGRHMRRRLRPPRRRWRRCEQRGTARRPFAMRNLRLLRSGGRRFATAVGTPQCFGLGAETGTVLVGCQHGLLELGPAGQAVRAALRRTGSRGLLSLSGSGGGDASACQLSGIAAGVSLGATLLRSLQSWDKAFGSPSAGARRCPPPGARLWAGGGCPPKGLALRSGV